MILIRIKDASAADIPLIRSLSEQIWPVAYNHIIGPDQVAYMLDLFYSAYALRQQLQEEGHKFILAFDEDMAVGFAAFSEIAPATYKLHKIYILPEQQGKGVGKEMLSHVLQKVKESGGTTLRLNVNRNNLPAMAFYEKAGFKFLETEDIDIGSGFFMNDYVMGVDVN